MRLSSVVQLLLTCVILEVEITSITADKLHSPHVQGVARNSAKTKQQQSSLRDRTPARAFDHGRPAARQPRRMLVTKPGATVTGGRGTTHHTSVAAPFAGGGSVMTTRVVRTTSHASTVTSSTTPAVTGSSATTASSSAAPAPLTTTSVATLTGASTPLTRSIRTRTATTSTSATTTPTTVTSSATTTPTTVTSAPTTVTSTPTTVTSTPTTVTSSTTVTTGPLFCEGSGSVLHNDYCVKTSTNPSLCCAAGFYCFTYTPPYCAYNNWRKVEHIGVVLRMCHYQYTICTY